MIFDASAVDATLWSDSNNQLWGCRESKVLLKVDNFPFHTLSLDVSMIQGSTFTCLTFHIHTPWISDKNIRPEWGTRIPLSLLPEHKVGQASADGRLGIRETGNCWYFDVPLKPFDIIHTSRQRIYDKRSRTVAKDITNRQPFVKSIRESVHSDSMT